MSAHPEPVVTLAVFAHSPTPSGVKSRLQLPPEAAARLYAAFVRDTMRTMNRLDLPITVYHDGERSPLKPLVSSQVQWASQGEGDLGERLARVPAPCLMFGMDTPHLPFAFLRQAQAAIPHYDVVLGPADSGGFYCLGLQMPQPNLFQGIARGGDKTAAQIRGQAEAIGLSVFTLPSFYTLETRDDLRRLKRRLEEVAPASGDDCPATRNVLKTFSL